MKLTLFFSGWLILISCSFKEKKTAISFMDDPNISLESKLRKVLEKDYLLKLGFQHEQIESLQGYYKRMNYKPLWVNDSTVSDEGRELHSILSNCFAFGIAKNRLFEKKHNLKWIEEEVYLTANISLIYSDLNYGYIDFQHKKYKERKLSTTESFDSLITLKKHLIFDSILLNVHSSDTSYQFMARGLYDFSKSVKVDTFNYSFKAEKSDSIAFKKTAEALVRRGLLNQALVDNFDEWRNSVKQLQKWHGLSQHGHLDKNTCAALNESNYRKALRIAIELDKLRCRTKRPKKYVLINIPSFQLQLYAEDTLRSVHRMITGKALTPTPTLQSKINKIIVYPFWNVPYSIAKNEILPAVKRNVNYLKRNNYRIYSNGKEINPYNINWKRIHNSFPFKIVQDPGPENSLGIIKFEFNNNYSVYVHDTPSKSLFNTDVRTYSHGCMRCQHPVELGKKILQYDSLPNRRNEFTSDSLDTLIGRAQNFPIRLIDPVPIFVEYHTVTASREQLVVHMDVYKKEEEFIKFMEK